MVLKRRTLLRVEVAWLDFCTVGVDPRSKLLMSKAEGVDKVVVNGDDSEVDPAIAFVNDEIGKVELKAGVEISGVTLLSSVAIEET